MPSLPVSPSIDAALLGTPASAVAGSLGRFVAAGAALGTAWVPAASGASLSAAEFVRGASVLDAAAGCDGPAAVFTAAAIVG